ncbi:MAG: hypothetical protein AB1638_00715 [Nitrospirota bacterium]
MEELVKIRSLLDYWLEHNNEHAEMYMNWANKALSFGNEELSKIFIRLYLESKRLNRLFEAAKKASS